MIRPFICMFLGFALLGMTACDDTEFRSVWVDPGFEDVDLEGASVAAVLLSQQESVRLAFEKDLAQELAKYGIEGIPGYTLVPTLVTDRREALRLLQSADVEYTIMMRVVGREREQQYVPGSAYSGFYDPYWGGGFYYSPGYFITNTFVSVEIVFRSVPDEQILFAGLSRTMNPDDVADFVKDLVKATAKELGMEEVRDEG